MKNNYEKQAIDFLKSTETTLSMEYLDYNVYFPQDKDKRDIWQVTLNNARWVYKFTFGNSIMESKDFDLSNIWDTIAWLIKRYMSKTDKNLKDLTQQQLDNLMFSSYSLLPVSKLKEIHWKQPSAYNILASMDLIYSDTFEDFCDDFGYENDSITAKKTYDDCLKQDRNLRKLFDHKELELLSEIN